MLNNRHAWRLWLVAFFIMVLLCVLAIALRPKTATIFSGAIVYSFPYERVAHELDPYGFKGLGKIGDGQRTVASDGLVVRGVDGNGPGGSAWIVKDGFVRKVYFPSGVPYVDANGNIFAWATTNMVFVASGSRFAVQFMRQYVALDPEGKYVLVTKNTGGDSWRSWIQATNTGSPELWACNDADCESLARAAGKLFVWGVADQGRPVCFIIDETGGKLTEERRLNIESGHIQDVDASGRYLLILRGGPGSYLSTFDTASGVERSCEISAEYWNFFLKNDPFVGTNL